ncbi:MAG: phosphoserine phosphatase SerB [Pseudomonadota bacterium]
MPPRRAARSPPNSGGGGKAAVVLVLTASGSLPDAALARCTLLRRLGPDAAEVEVEAEVKAVGGALAGLPVDLNRVPDENRRKRLLIADMDSTMISVECIDELADFAGVRDRVAAITEVAMRGDISFEDSLAARVALMAGLPEGALARAYAERVHLNPGARRLVQTMNAHGALTALVSGGFTYFTQRVAAEAGFARHRANTLLFENGRLTGAVALPILGRHSKGEALDALCAEAGVSRRDALAVGDGANDLTMIEAAGLGVAYRAKPVLAAAADARIDHGDLSALLALQGYASTEHAT